jgi:outer membrane protein OmpA-like peptidoglycan-associated protein
VGHALCALVVTSLAHGSDAPTLQIPFVVGLTIVRATSEPRGDYETLRVIDDIGANGYRVVFSGEVPADDDSGLMDIRIVRTVSATDQLSARKMRVYHHSGDMERFPGTVPGFSAAMLNDLRNLGKASFTYQRVNVVFGMSMVQELSGNLVRVGTPAKLPMLVNGRHALLPVIHSKGNLSDDGGAEQFEFFVLDDPHNPIVLRWSGDGAASQVLRIEYPEPDAIERTLAENDTARLYGIYFSFARADLRAQSERTLKEIASVLDSHPDWKLRIDGHTDNIGNDAENLNLSRQRAAAVKTALVSRFRIEASRLTTGGYGETSPREKNDTPEGRALNRRVELTRL